MVGYGHFSIRDEIGTPLALVKGQLLKIECKNDSMHCF